MISVQLRSKYIYWGFLHIPRNYPFQESDTRAYNISRSIIEIYSIYQTIVYKAFTAYESEVG